DDADLDGVLSIGRTGNYDCGECGRGEKRNSHVSSSLDDCVRARPAFFSVAAWTGGSIWPNCRWLTAEFHRQLRHRGKRIAKLSLVLLDQRRRNDRAGDDDIASSQLFTVSRE